MTGIFISRGGRLGLASAAALALVAGGLAREPAAKDEPVAGSATGPVPKVWRHDDWIAGLTHRDLEVRDAAAVFAAVFAQLPDDVQVLPTENYYYWQMAAGGRVLQGNIRLAVGGRERGELAFAYGEPSEFLDDAERADRLAVSKTFTAADGVAVRMQDAFTASIAHRGKTVVFHLNRLAQELPFGFSLAPGERFLQRTQDESGLRFYLLYHSSSRYFFWVLDETEPVPDAWRPLAPDIVLGRRTGFVFWIQEKLGGRKVLASVRQASLQRNDYHDGPFDQLADNFVKGEGLRPFLEEAMPWLRGRVDRWGTITDGPAPRRVALTVYGRHERPADAVALIAAAKEQADPVRHLSQGGAEDRGAR